MKHMVQITLTLIVAVVALASLGTADVPQMINYQGRLTDQSGDPLGDTVIVSLTFTIYDAPSLGNVIWTEAHPICTVFSGLFNVILGAGSPPVPITDDVFNQPDRWLAIAVGGDPEILPRTKLTSVAYAYHSQQADTCAFALDGGWWVRTDTDQVLYTKGYLGIARGDADNVLDGIEGSRSLVNLGVACTTGYAPNTAWYSTISGGYRNVAIYPYTTVGGGTQNVAGGNESTVGGGIYNHANGDGSTVGGGEGNFATSWYAAVSGGFGNAATGMSSAVGGGEANTSSGSYSVVPGGTLNSAAGDYSFAAGRRAKANHDGTFVWADSTDADFASTGENQFLIRASGGVGIGTTAPASILHLKGSGFSQSFIRVEDDYYNRTWKLESNADGFQIAEDGFVAYVTVEETSGRVGIGTAYPQGALDVSSTTGAFIVPRMTTAERDALTAVNGMIIYNTTDNQFNFYENGAWVTK
jgi:hypothetical protein